MALPIRGVIFPFPGKGGDIASCLTGTIDWSVYLSRKVGFRPVFELGGKPVVHFSINYSIQEYNFDSDQLSRIRHYGLPRDDVNPKNIF